MSFFTKWLADTLRLVEERENPWCEFRAAVGVNAGYEVSGNEHTIGPDDLDKVEGKRQEAARELAGKNVSAIIGVRWVAYRSPSNGEWVLSIEGSCLREELAKVRAAIEGLARKWGQEYVRLESRTCDVEEILPLAVAPARVPDPAPARVPATQAQWRKTSSPRKRLGVFPLVIRNCGFPFSNLKL